MKSLEKIEFSAEQCAQELIAFKKLLQGSPSLEENKDIKPSLTKAKHLTAFIGTYFPDIGPANVLAYEFEIAGDFAADIVIGNLETQNFCMVELEDASPLGIFVPGNRRVTQWNPRFEHGFSQLVDWFYALDDLRGTERFTRDFGLGHVIFHGLLMMGRSDHVKDEDRNRLRWRAEHVLVNSKKINCLTYDELSRGLERRLREYPAAVRILNSPAESI